MCVSYQNISAVHLAACLVVLRWLVVLRGLLFCWELPHLRTVHKNCLCVHMMRTPPRNGARQKEMRRIGARMPGMQCGLFNAVAHWRPFAHPSLFAGLLFAKLSCRTCGMHLLVQILFERRGVAWSKILPSCCLWSPMRHGVCTPVPCPGLVPIPPVHRGPTPPHSFRTQTPALLHHLTGQWSLDSVFQPKSAV